MFIALEGADGCGKTTLCKLLSERMGGFAYSTPPQKYLNRRESIDRNSSNEDHYNFYRNGIYDASEEIKLLLMNGSIIISDRYWLTTYTYHQVMGANVSREDFLTIIQPDLTILLTLNGEVQTQRILSRGISAGDCRMLKNQAELAQAFYKNSLEFNIPFLVIDTQRFSPEACVDIVLSSIK